jgi:membrane protein required for colicin V production
MPITILDLILLAVMLISGLLALVRGFMREILSIAAWGAAALVTLYAFGKLLPTAKTYIQNETIASVAVVAGVFIGTLILVVAYQFFIWLVPDKQRPDWVTAAKSRTVLDGTGQWLMSLLPDDPENTILKRFKKNKPDDEQTDAEPVTPAPADGYSKAARDGLKKQIDKVGR